eukprot:CAMPEP_0184350970 /NCGR_PEP_ID=MMETSP1089-20130417/43285_1 /TAXON_ID=38269 ORGANISM="Gloeochaete wittrockiana, Strain SAG46.84" /NCGR_SAMPLE_ID=MMETSP1089 /ASSEMBLY_ACC=CAM_ASM_000445 /LENGTH=170 /DNA_ID=CAMNT_0026684117 /DNA_START=28 /DNA_END=540 /DNA_ORIENTATION=-
MTGRPLSKSSIVDKIKRRMTNHRKDASSFLGHFTLPTARTRELLLNEASASDASIEQRVEHDLIWDPSINAYHVPCDVGCPNNMQPVLSGRELAVSHKIPVAHQRRVVEQNARTGDMSPSGVATWMLSASCWRIECPACNLKRNNKLRDDTAGIKDYEDYVRSIYASSFQ